MQRDTREQVPSLAASFRLSFSWLAPSFFYLLGCLRTCALLCAAPHSILRRRPALSSGRRFSRPAHDARRVSQDDCGRASPRSGWSLDLRDPRGIWHAKAKPERINASRTNVPFLVERPVSRCALGLSRSLDHVVVVVAALRAIAVLGDFSLFLSCPSFSLEAASTSVLLLEYGVHFLRDPMPPPPQLRTGGSTQAAGSSSHNERAFVVPEKYAGSRTVFHCLEYGVARTLKRAPPRYARLGSTRTDQEAGEQEETNLFSPSLYACSRCVHSVHVQGRLARRSGRPVSSFVLSTECARVPWRAGTTG